MSDFVSRALCLAGLPAWARRRRRRQLTILMYHGVVERPLEVDCWHQLPLDAFRRQMAWVARRYAVRPLEDALAGLVAGTLPDRALALTFDDGYRNVRTVAGPVLEAHRLPATVFLVTDVVGTDETVWPDHLYLAFARSSAKGVDVPDLGLARRAVDTRAGKAAAYATSVQVLKGLPTAERAGRMAALLAALGRPGPEAPGDFRMLGWDDVDAMRRTGLWTFAGHTTRHEILARMPDGTVAAAIGRSHEVVAQRTGHVPTVFAYPNGRAMDFDDRARTALTHLGVRFALSTVEGFNDAATDRLALERISVGADLSFARFRLLASGALASLRGRR